MHGPLDHVDAQFATEATAVPQHSKRALRFERRLRGERELQFADLMQQRKAANCARTNGERFFMVLALLDAKQALDRELSGAVLQKLACTIGEELLDAALELDVSDLPVELTDAPLPSASDLLDCGERLLARMKEEPQIAHLSQRAEDILSACAPDGRYAA